MLLSEQQRLEFCFEQCKKKQPGFFYQMQVGTWFIGHRQAKTDKAEEIELKGVGQRQRPRREGRESPQRRSLSRWLTRNTVRSPKKEAAAHSVTFDSRCWHGPRLGGVIEANTVLSGWGTHTAVITGSESPSTSQTCTVALLHPVHISDSVHTQSLGQPLHYNQEETLRHRKHHTWYFEGKWVCWQGAVEKAFRLSVLSKKAAACYPLLEQV